jgi:hypothetical protein
VDRWSREISGMTVSSAYRTGLKQRMVPSPFLTEEDYYTLGTVFT